MNKCPESWEQMREKPTPTINRNVNYADAMNDQSPVDNSIGIQDQIHDQIDANVFEGESDFEYLSESYNTFVADIFESSVNCALSAEAVNCAILDTACVQTVCGKQWFEAFSEQFDTPFQQVNPPDHCMFKFGAGQLPSLGFL